jgi:hypothetical protein
MKIAASPLNFNVHNAFQFSIHPFNNNGKLQFKKRNKGRSQRE